MFYLRRLILILLTILISPFLIVLGATLLFFNAVHLMTRFTRQRLPAEGPPLSGLASIIILNWNGKDLLAQGLPSVLEAVRVDGRPHEVLVVDNGSADGSADFVKAAFPQVRILSLPENLGFAEGNNAGVRAAQHDVVVMLNNDMVVEPGFLQPLLDGFGPCTFAVSSQIYLQNPSARREETGKTTACFKRGMIDYAHCVLDGKFLRRRHYPAFWAGGGSSAFHRERFLSLGGFRELYSPAYVEDADLSYQAWKIGWEVLFAPQSVVYHKHRASSTLRFRPLELETLIKRNQFLFLWKNIRSWRFLISHCFFLPWNCYRLARDYGVGIWRCLYQGILRLPEVEIEKLGAPFRGVRLDREIFKLFAKPGLFFAKRRAGEQACRPGGSELEASQAGGSDTRPRVLWLTAYLPHLGRHAGAGRMLQLLRRLSQRYRITVLSFLEHDEERECLPELEALCERVAAFRRSPPLRWQLFVYEPFDEFRTPQMQEAVYDSLENYDFHLVQMEYSQMACYADRSYGIPSVLTKHEVDFAACARRARLQANPWRKLRWFYNYLQVLDREIHLLRRVDAAICMTDPDRIELQKFCRSVPIHVINTGVDLSYFEPPASPARESRLIFVGAFQHLPNVDAMAYFCHDVFPLIRTQVPNAELLIVGSRPPPQIISLGEQPGIRVTGYVPDIRPFMAASAVYVVPLRLGVGIRGKILEAWGMALPVVATPVACAGLRYQDEKNLLVAHTPEEFAAQVITLLRDPELRDRMGAEGRKTAQQYYSWEVSANQLIELYEALIGKGLTSPDRAARPRAGRSQEAAPPLKL